jgi:hypothetical protein
MAPLTSFSACRPPLHLIGHLAISMAIHSHSPSHSSVLSYSIFHICWSVNVAEGGEQFPVFQIL